MSLVALKLERASEWPVLLTILLMQARYGGAGKFASITSADIAAMCGYSQVTVFRALRSLANRGIIARTRPRGPLVCRLFDETPGCDSEGKSARRATKLPPEDIVSLRPPTR